MHSSSVYVVASALIDDIAVPVEAETFQRSQDASRAPGHNTGCIEILDADQPAAAVMACIEIAADRSQK